MKPLGEELQEIREEFDRNFVHVRNNEPKDDQFAGEKYLPRKVKDFYEQKIRQLVEEREKEFKIARAREITNLMDKDEYVKNSWCQSYIEDTEYDDSMDRADEYDEMASLVEKLDNEENGFIDPKDLPF